MSVRVLDIQGGRSVGYFKTSLRWIKNILIVALLLANLGWLTAIAMNVLMDEKFDSSFGYANDCSVPIFAVNNIMIDGAFYTNVFYIAILLLLCIKKTSLLCIKKSLITLLLLANWGWLTFIAINVFMETKYITVFSNDCVDSQRLSIVFDGVFYANLFYIAILLLICIGKRYNYRNW